MHKLAALIALALVSACGEPEPGSFTPSPDAPAAATAACAIQCDPVGVRDYFENDARPVKRTVWSADGSATWPTCANIHGGRSCQIVVDVTCGECQQLIADPFCEPGLLRESGDWSPPEGAIYEPATCPAQ